MFQRYGHKTEGNDETRELFPQSQGLSIFVSGRFFWRIERSLLAYEMNIRAHEEVKQWNTIRQRMVQRRSGTALLA
jgi:hypothetical protein